MTDITLYVRAVGTKQSEDGKNGRRWKAGEIVAVYARDQVSDSCRAKRMVFIHVDNVPASLEKIQEKLQGPTHIDDNPFKEMASKCRWWIRPSTLPAGVRTKLLADRQVTGEWESFKPFLKHQVRKVSITDGDL